MKNLWEWSRSNTCLLLHYCLKNNSSKILRILGQGSCRLFSVFPLNKSQHALTQNADNVLS